MSPSSSPNIDQSQIDHFSAHSDWWDLRGSYRSLHQINPTRVEFIQAALADSGKRNLESLRVLDVGCGGGILSLALARAGARVTGIDAEAKAIAAATAQARLFNLEARFIVDTAENHPFDTPYDLILCCELLEHVPDPDRLIGHCARLADTGGVVIFSTLDRSWKSFFGAIVAAEYLLKIVPEGTHRYSDFIRPSELHRCADRHRLDLLRLNGMSYHPWSGDSRLTTKIDINYFAAYRKLAPAKN